MGLDAIQRDVLRALAAIHPPWTLTGGGALVGVHLGHRLTRDLDLFWHGRRSLDELPDEVERRLKAVGFEVQRLNAAPAFVRFNVRRGPDSTVLDLVADEVDVIEPAVSAMVAGVEIQVDTPHEILVNKVTTLVSRSEIRDLIDVEALLADGGDLDRALVDAASKDGGFSAMTCAWVLEQLPVERLAKVAGLSAEEGARLRAFQADLVARLRVGTRP